MIAAARTAASTLARTGRQIATGLALAALLVTLTACAGGNANSGLTTSDAASVPPASAPPATASTAAMPTVAATPAPAAPAAPPQRLTATQINEKCWMRTEQNKAGDIDKRMRLVDKCVEEMKRAQGGV